MTFSNSLSLSLHKEVSYFFPVQSMFSLFIFGKEQAISLRCGEHWTGSRLFLLFFPFIVLANRRHTMQNIHPKWTILKCLVATSNTAEETNRLEQLTGLSTFSSVSPFLLFWFRRTYKLFFIATQISELYQTIPPNYKIMHNFRTWLI